MADDFIKSYWENQAQKHQGSHEASWGDNFMLSLEIETIGQHISSGSKVLDVGCANGFSTFQQLEKCQLESITGIDFASNMIAAAEETKQQKGLGDEINFSVGDIRELNFPDNSFDVVYTTRVIINLPNWQEQLTGINECIRVAKPGAKIIFCEAFWEPLILLNALRALKQLPPLVEHDFNRYLKKSQLEKFLSERNLTYTNDDFSSVYYLGSRFLRDLVTDIDAYPGFTNPINQIFFELERTYSGGGFGIQQAYIIEKE